MELSRRTPAVLVVVALLVAGCAASYHWENPQQPRERWVADEASCRRQAAAEVDQEQARDLRYYGDPNIGNVNTLEARLAAYETGKRRDAHFKRCMMARGYTRVRRARSD